MGHLIGGFDTPKPNNPKSNIGLWTDMDDCVRTGQIC